MPELDKAGTLLSTGLHNTLKNNNLPDFFSYQKGFGRCSFGNAYFFAWIGWNPSDNFGNCAWF